MQVEIFQALVAQRPGLRINWERLLRVERVSSPLANPDTLVHLLDLTIAEIFKNLQFRSSQPPTTRVTAPHCPCGLNPLIAYFSAGLQAVREALIYAQVSIPSLAASERDASLARLNEVFAHIARREIESFCGVCQYRRSAQPPRWQPRSTFPSRKTLPPAASPDKPTAPHRRPAGIPG